MVVRAQITIDLSQDGEDGLGHVERAVLAGVNPLGVDYVNCSLLKFLNRKEAEHAVFHDGASERAAELVSPISTFRRIGNVLCVGLPVQVLVAEKLETAAMKLVGARLGEHVDDAVAGAPLLSRKTMGDHLKLLNGFQADGLEQSAVEIFVVVGVIDIEVGIACPAAAGRR